MDSREQVAGNIVILLLIRKEYIYSFQLQKITCLKSTTIDLPEAVLGIGCSVDS